MPARLRDLIVEQRRLNSPASTLLGEFAEELAADRLKAAEAPVDDTADLLKTKQDILAEASKALVAQATHTQESVLALLKTD